MLESEKEETTTDKVSMTSIRFASFDVNICKIDFSLSIFVERSTLFIDGLARRILVCTMLDDRQIGRTQ